MPISFAQRLAHTRPSDIREIITKTAGGNYLSFAGGMPDPALFPVEELAFAAQKVLREHPERALQYGPTQGLLPLRERIAVLMGEIGVRTDSDHIHIISGAQQGLGLSGGIFLDPGEAVIVERPTYSAVLNALDMFQSTYLDLECDEDGPDIDQLRSHLRSNPPPKLAYVIPNFQNPSGRTWSASRRKSFLEAFDDSETLILEDDPYGQLGFHGQAPNPLKANDPDERVIYLGSFSKVLSPGLRVGWIVASAEILERYNLAKQNNDLHTSAFDQELINAYLEIESLPAQIERLCEAYTERCGAILAALETEFPEGTHFTRPKGGLFTWIELPGSMDARELLGLAMKEKVVFIPGDGFFANNPRRNTMRLNFSAMGVEKIKEGMAILGKIVRNYKKTKEIL